MNALCSRTVTWAVVVCFGRGNERRTQNATARFPFILLINFRYCG